MPRMTVEERRAEQKAARERRLAIDPECDKKRSRNRYRSDPEHRAKILAAIDRCYSKGEFVLRNDLAVFERNLAKFLGVKYAYGCLRLCIFFQKFIHKLGA